MPKRNPELIEQPKAPSSGTKPGGFVLLARQPSDEEIELFVAALTGENDPRAAQPEALRSS